jgi:hypothetical protein
VSSSPLHVFQYSPGFASPEEELQWFLIDENQEPQITAMRKAIAENKMAIDTMHRLIEELREKLEQRSSLPH